MEVNITPRIINSLSLQFCNIIESIAVLWRRNIRVTQLVSPRRLSEKVPPTRNQLPVQIYPNNQNPEEQLTRYSLQICDIRERSHPGLWRMNSQLHLQLVNDIFSTSGTTFLPNPSNWNNFQILKTIGIQYPISPDRKNSFPDWIPSSTTEKSSKENLHGILKEMVCAWILPSSVATTRRIIVASVIWLASHGSQQVDHGIQPNQPDWIISIVSPHHCLMYPDWSLSRTGLVWSRQVHQGGIWY